MLFPNNRSFWARKWTRLSALILGSSSIRSQNKFTWNPQQVYSQKWALKCHTWVRIYLSFEQLLKSRTLLSVTHQPTLSRCPHMIIKCQFQFGQSKQNWTRIKPFESRKRMVSLNVGDLLWSLGITVKVLSDKEVSIGSEGVYLSLGNGADVL